MGSVLTPPDLDSNIISQQTVSLFHNIFCRLHVTLCKYITLTIICFWQAVNLFPW